MPEQRGKKPFPWWRLFHCRNTRERDGLGHPRGGASMLAPHSLFLDGFAALSSRFRFRAMSASMGGDGLSPGDTRRTPAGPGGTRARRRDRAGMPGSTRGLCRQLSAHCAPLPPCTLHLPEQKDKNVFLPPFRYVARNTPRGRIHHGGGTRRGLLFYAASVPPRLPSSAPVLRDMNPRFLFVDRAQSQVGSPPGRALWLRS